MKKIVIAILIISICFISLSACTTEKENVDTTNDLDWGVVEDSYNYVLPLVMVNTTKEKMTNIVTSSGTQAPINQLAHAKELANAKSLNVVTPNTDTIYSQAFLDLTDTAMVLVKPKVDRFVTIQVMDAYTNTVRILGTGGDTQDHSKYLFTGPDYKGDVPSDMKQVALPQNMAWILIRTLSKGLDDVKNIHAIQDEFQLLPLEDYQIGGDNLPQEGVYDEKLDFVPVKHVLQMTPQEYFDTANRLMLENPSTEIDNDIMKAMATINVGPGKIFQVDALGENVGDKWKNMILNLEANLSKDCQNFRVNKGQWKYFGEPISEFGKEYSYRALVSLGGLGANPIKDAIYLRGDLDQKGDQINGKEKYMIHFEKDGLPKTQDNGFWSITAYNSANFLIDNPLNRYDINDRDNFIFNEDGSLDIIVQTDAPADSSMENNWLPISEDDVHLFMRIYLPHEDVISEKWQAPTIIKK